MARSCVDLTVFTLSQIGAISLMNESGPPPIEGSVQSLSMWGVSILRIKIIEPVIPVAALRALITVKESTYVVLLLSC